MRHKTFLLLAAALTFTCACRNTVAEVEIHPIQDNAQPRLMQRALFSEAPDSLIAELGLEEGIPASVCAFLVKADGKEILFDAANGAHNSQLVPKLISLEVKPEDIDHIFITHLHGDHIGGLTADDKAVFPNARLHINTVELDAWMAMPEEQTARIRKMIELYEDRLDKFTLDDTLPCGIKAIEAYGHTPGHTVYQIGTNIIAGDIMHGTALQVKYPQYSARFDMDKTQAVETRKAVMKTAQEEGLRVYGMHFPDPYWL
ncbi:MAG: MBL fold metallo-hydrolase [Bacteroidales bacterium]|nr:MBL fold metallo-hydrolase [Bacteroidales bacterium]